MRLENREKFEARISSIMKGIHAEWRRTLVKNKKPVDLIVSRKRQEQLNNQFFKVVNQSATALAEAFRIELDTAGLGDSVAKHITRPFVNLVEDSADNMLDKLEIEYQGFPFSDLMEKIDESYFIKSKQDMAAVTETTRCDVYGTEFAFHQGIESGRLVEGGNIKQGMIEKNSLDVLRVRRVWLAEIDSSCSICSQFHGTTPEFWGDHRIPIHPNCRCRESVELMEEVA